MNTNLKPTLWALLFTIVVILWFKWDAANTPVVATTKPISQQQSSEELPIAADGDAVGVEGMAAAMPVAAPVVKHSGKLVKVKTDVLELLIDTQGGTIVESKLLDYTVSIKDKTPIKLFNSTPEKLFHLSSGVISSLPTKYSHTATFSAEKGNYTLVGDKLEVPLTWTENGVTVTKVFTFYQGRYDFDIAHHINNQSSQAWNGRQYSQLKRAEVIVEYGLTTFNTFAGAAYSTPEKKYNKLSFSELASPPLDVKGVTGGWEAMIEHYFMGALIPIQTEKNSFYSRKTADGNYEIGLFGLTKSVAAGTQASFATRGFVGPKIKNDLARIAPNLDKATDYGWLFFISEFLFNILDWMHGIVKNWGWAIVIVTLLIKAILFPLAAKSFKSMAKMRKFQPEMERMRENYKEDRQLLGKKMMELYKKEGINPASGCLPILVQIPIFLAFYYMLMESVELRQAPWIFWIEDLSIKDPFYILPAINMVLMFVQQRLNPPPSDPMQRRVMMALPLVFGVFFLFFPSGLVLYWAVSNLFSIIQQYVITKRYGGLANPLSHADEKTVKK